MTIDKNVQHFVHVLDLYAKSKGWKLSQYAESIVNHSVTRCDGCCPCDSTRGFCPCNQHENEVLNNGHCHCTLFVKD